MMGLFHGCLVKGNKVAALMVIAVLVLSLSAVSIVPKITQAQTWPSSWTTIDQDGNEDGAADDYLDVKTAWYNYDDNYLYLRLSLYGAPDFSGPARYKWFIDLGVGDNLSISGNNIFGAEYLLFVEDSKDDGMGKAYLLADTDSDGRFSEYEPNKYVMNPGPTNSSIAGYRFDGNCVDLYLKLSALNTSDPWGINLAWASDQENQNLEQAPNSDSIDASDVPIHLAPVLTPAIDVTKTDLPDPVEAGGDLTYTLTCQNMGNAIAHNLTAVDYLPVEVTYISAEPEPTSVSDGTLTWEIGDLSPEDGQKTITIYGNVNASTPDGTILNNYVTITCAEKVSDDDSEETTVLVTAPADTTPPAAVSDLSVDSPRSTSLTLTWTAPGDDGNLGNATEYDVRYSTVGVIDTEEEFDAATRVEGEPTPAVAGSSESFVLTRLVPNTSYWFALKTADEVPNWSQLSNSPSGITLPAQAPEPEPEPTPEPEPEPTPKPTPEPLPPTIVLKIEVTGDPALSPGYTQQFDLLVSMLSDGALANVVYELPGYLVITDISVSPQGVCSVSGNQISVSIGDLPPGQTIVTVTTEVNEELAIDATLDTLSHYLPAMPGLLTTMSSDCATVSPGDEVRLTAELTNLGQGGASSVAIDYRLPFELTIIEVSVAPKGIISILGDEIDAHLGTIESRGSATITVTAKVGQEILPDTPINELLESISPAVSAKP